MLLSESKQEKTQTMYYWRLISFIKLDEMRMENINMKNSEETMIECNFTESEIKMLSDVVLMQIKDLGHAMQL